MKDIKEVEEAGAPVTVERLVDFRCILEGSFVVVEDDA